MNIENTIVISDSVLQRKGARKLSDIPKEVVELIQKGKLE
jgi:hypothetical protein